MPLGAAPIAGFGVFYPLYIPYRPCDRSNMPRPCWPAGIQSRDCYHLRQTLWPFYTFVYGTHIDPALCARWAAYGQSPRPIHSPRSPKPPTAKGARKSRSWLRQRERPTAPLASLVLAGDPMPCPGTGCGWPGWGWQLGLAGQRGGASRAGAGELLVRSGAGPAGGRPERQIP